MYRCVFSRTGKDWTGLCTRAQHAHTGTGLLPRHICMARRNVHACPGRRCTRRRGRGLARPCAGRNKRVAFRSFGRTQQQDSARPGISEVIARSTRARVMYCATERVLRTNRRTFRNMLQDKGELACTGTHRRRQRQYHRARRRRRKPVAIKMRLTRVHPRLSVHLTPKHIAKPWRLATAEVPGTNRNERCLTWPSINAWMASCETRRPCPRMRQV